MSASDRRGSRSKKDQENAARMKKLGITRGTANCPICHRTTSLGHMQNHINTCTGR